jgi:FG-GAP-like repeat
VDINGDGIRDILSGSYSRMEEEMAGLFQVLYGKADGTFRAAEVLLGTDGEPLIIPLNGLPMTENICTRPCAVDWDADGALDLVVGNFSGTFYWFKGEGKGKFQPKPEAITVGEEPLKILGHHSDPFVVDWDGDGDLDLLSGSSNGGVQWAKNGAGKGKLPELAAFQSLLEPGQPIQDGRPLGENDLTGPTTSTRVWADDVNGDGKLDLLVGDSVTLVAPAKGLSAEEFKKKYDAWQTAIAKASREQASQAADPAKRAKASQEFSRLYQKRGEFMKEDSTGFVWLYLQK